MRNALQWTEQDVLHVVQCMAQAHGGKSHRQVVDRSLFVEMQSTAEFCTAQVAPLAQELLHFFCLTDDAATEAALEAALTRQPNLTGWARLLFAHWDKATVSFRSSGSTGIPTRHRTPVALLAEEVQACAPRFHTRRRVISVMPVHHIYGMVYGPVFSKCMGVPLLFAPPLPLASFFALLQPGDFVVAFPLFWKALLSTCGTGHPFPEDVAGLTATSPCPPEVLHALITPRAPAQRPLLTNITEIYGSTETSALGMRCDAEAWYTLLPCWERVAEGDDAQAEPRVRRVHTRFPGEAVPLPDVVVWNTARQFKPHGRVDNAVQVGGLNVYPQKVAAVIRTHPCVRDCAVRLMRPEEGARLKAFIVPTLPREEAAEIFGKKFHSWLAARLDTASCPKRITLGDTLPTNAIGKASDWE